MTPQFWLLMLVTSLYFGATGGLNALIPPYVVDQLGGTEATAGFVMGSTALTALLARPWFGRLADQRGSNRLMVIGALLSTASLLFVAVSTTLAATVAFRLVIGAGGAAMMTGSALRAIELAPAGRQSQAASYMLISVHVGLGSGPILGEWLLSNWGYLTVWIVVGGAKLLSAVAALGLDRLPADPSAEPAPLINRHALLPGVVTLFGVFAFNGFLVFVPLYGREVGLNDVGLVFTTASLTIIVVRVTLSRVPDLIGPIKAGSAALVVTIVAACLVALWPTPTGVYVGAALMATGLSLQSPSFIPLAVSGVPDRERGSAMATFTGFYDIANAIVGPLLGLIVSGYGYQPAFLLTAGMAVVSLLLLNLVLGPRQSGRIAGLTSLDAKT